MTPVEQYAVEMVADAVRSVAEDDTNEDDKLSRKDHEEAVKLALRVAQVIEEHPERAIDLLVEPFDPPPVMPSPQQVQRDQDNWHRRSALELAVQYTASQDYALTRGDVVEAARLFYGFLAEGSK